MGEDEAERWIVNLIRNAQLDAKIDSARGHVIMGSQFPSVYVELECLRSHWPRVLITLRTGTSKSSIERRTSHTAAS